MAVEGKSRKSTRRHSPAVGGSGNDREPWALRHAAGRRPEEAGTRVGLPGCGGRGRGAPGGGGGGTHRQGLEEAPSSQRRPSVLASFRTTVSTNFMSQVTHCSGEKTKQPAVD